MKALQVPLALVLLICAWPGLASGTDFVTLLEAIKAQASEDPSAALVVLNEQLDEAHPLAQDLEQQTAQAALFRIRAELLRGRGDYAAAAADAERFADLTAAIDDRTLQARAIFLRGTIQAEQGFFGQALEDFHRARQLLEGSEDYDEQAMILNAIGMTHNFAGDFLRARAYFERALAKARQAGAQFRVATYLSNLAAAVAEIEGSQAAIAMQREVLSMAEAMDEPILATQAYVNLCNLLVESGALDEAAPACSRALELADEMDALRWRAGVRWALGRLALARDQLDEALAWQEDALGLAQGLVPVLEQEVLLGLAQLHVRRGEAELAGKRYQELLSFRDAALEKERQALLDELEVRYQLERAQAELELLRVSRELQETQIQLRNALLIALIIVLGLTLLAMAVSTRAHRIRVGLQRDLSRRNEELQEALAQISELASTDPLTGLLNRRAVEAKAREAMGRAGREQRPMSVLMCDIDHFKSINDQHGHAVGDELLIALADRLRQSSRETDLIARWGGEEFLCVLPKATTADADAASKRLRQDLLRNPIRTSSGPLPITLTSGIAEVQDDLEAAIDLADQSMYRGKRSGRDQTLVHDPSGAPERD